MTCLPRWKFQAFAAMLSWCFEKVWRWNLILIILLEGQSLLRHALPWQRVNILEGFPFRHLARFDKLIYCADMKNTNKREYFFEWVWRLVWLNYIRRVRLILSSAEKQFFTVGWFKCFNRRRRVENGCWKNRFWSSIYPLLRQPLL